MGEPVIIYVWGNHIKSLDLVALILIISSGLFWGIYGGIFSALWSSGVLIIHTVLYLSPLSLFYIISRVMVFFLIGIWLGKIFDIYHTRISELDSLLENIPDTIYFKDKEARFIRVSKSKAEEVGEDNCDNLYGKTDFDYYPVERAQQSYEDDMRVMKKGERVVRREENHCADGKRLWMESIKVPRYNKDGKIIGMFGISRDITERKKHEQKIRYLNFHDNMTGLYSRAYMEEEMERLDTKRQLPISVIMGDANGLKYVNDNYGHDKGDKLLIRTAEILTEACREEDIIARWGGDEFVILLPQTPCEKAESICERINQICNQSSKDLLPLSIALGSAGKNHSDQDLNEVLKTAEDNMYKDKLTKNRSTKTNILTTLLNPLKEKSSETEEHAISLQKMGQELGIKLGLQSSELDKLLFLIVLHDIGKTIFPKEILTKPREFTKEEWKVIKKHPLKGYQIASTTEEFTHIADGIRSHHEKWDGSGYPEGLIGKQIPLLARIIAIIDAYDVMTNSRVYKETLTKGEAIKELEKCAGSKFDPEIVGVFVKLVKKNKIDV